jgi:uncharacterized repeat protein (TIGR02543 family)
MYTKPFTMTLNRVAMMFVLVMLSTITALAADETRTFTFKRQSDNLSYIVYNNTTTKLSDSYFWDNSSVTLDGVTITVKGDDCSVMTMADSYQKTSGHTYCLWGNYTTTFTISHGSKYITSVKVFDAPTKSIKEAVSDETSCTLSVTFRQMYKIEVTLSDTKPVFPPTTHVVNYIDESGTSQTVDANILSDQTDLTAGWWVVDSDVTVSKRMNMNGTVNLILCDGCTLTADKGITVAEGNRLNVYCQTSGTGALVANGQNEDTGTHSNYFSGIGGYKYYQQGSGMRSKSAGTIAINGGHVTATGNYGASGIGGGDGGYTIIINGGTVNALGGGLAAGIGSSREQTENAGTVMINGGIVTATGGSGSAGWGGAGIGGGDESDGGTIVITGGNITATGGGKACGIGAGRGRSNATVNLGWTSPTDQITANSYSGTVTLTSSFMLHDTDTEATLNNIAGNTIVPKYTVSFEANGAKGMMSSLSKAAGISYELPAPAFTYYGHEFLGWYINATAYAAGDVITVNGDITATAKWQQITHDITFNLNGHGAAIDPQTVNYGDHAVEPAAPSASGYTFGGWFKEQACTNQWVFDAEQVTSDQELFAKWSTNAYSITYHLDGGVNAAGNPLSYTTEDHVSLTSPTRTGYTFTGWTGSNGDTPQTSVSINGSTGNKTYTAHWQINQYTITFDTDGGTPSTLASVTADFGTPVAVPAAVAKQGSLFKRWMVADDESDMPTSIPGRNITVKTDWISLCHYEYQAPTCTNDGWNDYYSGIFGHYYIENDDHLTYTEVNRVDRMIPALGHDWQNETWSWRIESYNGELVATLALTCSRCGRPDHTTTKNFNVEVTTEPTTTTDGVRTYTATIEIDGHAYTNTYQEAIPRTGAVALIYDPSDGTYEPKPYLYNAIYDARNGDVIQVLTDIDEDWVLKQEKVGTNKYEIYHDLTLDLNGHYVRLELLPVAYSLTIKNGTLKTYINNANGGFPNALTLDNATLEGVQQYEAEYDFWSDNIQWMADSISVTNGSTWNITGRSALGYGDDEFTLTIDSTSCVVMSKSTLSGYNMQRVGSQFAQYLPLGYSISLSSGDGLVMYNGAEYDGSVTLRIQPKNECILANQSDNECAIIAWDRQVADVTLQGRTFRNDGSWTTLCLPFEVDLTDTDCPLYGAVAKTLADVTVTDTDITLSFGDAVTTLQPGVPYIIRWTGSSDLVDPVFPGVTMVSSTPDDRTIQRADGHVRFIGYYDAFDIDTPVNDDLYFLAAGNTLKHADQALTLEACRAYFQFSETALTKQLVLDLGTETTGITSPSTLRSVHTPDAWYTLDGKQLSDTPASKGIYIRSNRPQIIR